MIVTVAVTVAAVIATLVAIGSVGIGAAIHDGLQNVKARSLR